MKNIKMIYKRTKAKILKIQKKKNNLMNDILNNFIKYKKIML